MGLVRRIAFTAVGALLACVTWTGTHAQTHKDPFHAADLNIAPDLNLDIAYVMSSPNQCGAFRLRRNGMIYSHQQLYEAQRELGMSLNAMNATARFNYPDDINCTFSVCVGTGWRVQLVFPIAMHLACSTDRTKCDCLEVYDGTTVEAPLLRTICGYQENVAPIETTSPDVTLRFETDRNCKSSLGFQVKWYAFRYNDDKPCTNEEFLCDTNRCIPKYFLCDDTYHCLDKTDEGSAGCSYEERLCRIVSTLARYKGLAVSIFVLLLLVLILGIVLCLYYVVRMRRNQVACTRVLSLKGDRKPWRGDTSGAHRPPSNAPPPTSNAPLPTSNTTQVVPFVLPPVNVIPPKAPITPPTIVPQRVIYQPGCVRNPHFEI